MAVMGMTTADLAKAVLDALQRELGDTASVQASVRVVDDVDEVGLFGTWSATVGKGERDA